MEADLRALATSWPCGWQEDDDLLTDISHPSACLTSFCPEFEPLVEELPAGLTAVEVFRRLQGLRHLLFLDSAVVQGKQGTLFLYHGFAVRILA
ncbi:MAG: hypothetical protein KatS3mg105_2480 [Gemmatales bacterium]|nr:MAG: hypothetical protein KatS3mg105_2480 [Gemmatales bacterium]